MFSAEVNSTLFSLLAAKGYDYVPEGRFTTAGLSIAYILEDTKIVGMGVCLRAASVLVHKRIIGNNKEPLIYLRQNELKASTILKKVENDIALLLVRNNHFFFRRMFLNSLDSEAPSS